VYHRLLVRGKRISAIAAICSEGLVDYELHSGTINGHTFADFVRGNLIPNMQPFDGTNSRSICILDNCSIHHIQEVKDLFQEAGILVFYLPPYSPDYMPIEETFSYIKYYLKEHNELIQVLDHPMDIIKAAFDSVIKSQCEGWIHDCGYA